VLESQVRLAVVVRQREAAVAADPEALLVVRIEPDRVPAVHAAALRRGRGLIAAAESTAAATAAAALRDERLAAVGGPLERDVVVVRLLVVERTHRDVFVVER